MKQLLAVACAIATLSMIGCAGPTQPQEPAAKQVPTATEEAPITSMDFESGEAETPTETSEKTEADPYAVAD